MAYSYLDLGYDALLSREDSSGADLAALAEYEAAGISSSYSELVGGSYNGTSDLVEDSVAVSDLESGEYAEHLILADDGHVRGGASGYDEGVGFWLGNDVTDDTYKFFIGNSSGDKLTWDGTTLSIIGTLSVGSDVGGWVITADTIYSLASGTPTASPSDGIVLDSSNPVITIYEGTSKRVELGYLSAAVFGLKGYATDGTTVLFELSDSQNSISGLTMAQTSLAVSTNIVIDSSNKAFSINSSTFGSDGIQLQYNSGNPRAYIGDGSTYFFSFDGTNISWGAVNTTLSTDGKLTTVSADIGGWNVVSGYIYNLQSGTPTAAPSDGVVIASGNEAVLIYEDTEKRAELGYISAGVYGLKLYATDGTTVVFEASDTQQRMAGWYFTDTVLRSSTTSAASNVLIDSANSLIRLGPTSGDYITVDGANKRIRSSDYVSGANGAGFTLEPDLLEVGNIAARGIIRTAVFEKDVISAVGGNFAVVDSDKLNADMTALDASTLTISGNTTFAVGDILRIKDGVDDEWFTVTSAASAPTYSVTRDRASAYAADSNPAWKNGASVVNYQQSGDGLIYMTASETNAPYLSVLTHAGSPWSTLTTRLRIGNLNGYLGYVADTYGMGVGSSSSGEANITIEPTNGIRIRTGTTVLFQVDNSGNATIGGWTLDVDEIKDAAGVVGMSSAVTGGDDIRFWAGDATPASAEFRVYESGALVASSATISGSVTATSGAIGGFTIGSDYIRDAADSFGMASTVTGGDDVRFWAGDTFANRATADFFVTESGALTATSATISGDLTAQVSLTAGEALAASDLVGSTSADTVKRVAPSSLPATFDSTSSLAATLVWMNDVRVGIAVKMTDSLMFFAYEDTNSDSVGAITVVLNTTGTTISSVNSDRELWVHSNPTSMSATRMDSTRVLVTSCKSNSFQAAISDASSLGTAPTSVTVDNTNVNDGFGAYISDSHVLFVSQDTSSGNIQFYKYTASSLTLTSSSSGTLSTTFAGDTYVIQGFCQFADSAYFLLVVQNTTDATAYALVAHYDTGSSSWDSVGSPVSFTSISATRGDNAAMASLSSTQMMVFCPTSSTAGKYFLVTRSGVTPTVSSLYTATTRTSNDGYCLTPVNSRCAYLSISDGSTGVVATLLEVDSTGAALVERASRTYTTSPVSGSLEVAFPSPVWATNPTYMAFLAIRASTDDPEASVSQLTLPPTVGFAKAAASASASVTVITAGKVTSLSGLTSSSKYFADIGGTVSADPNGTPDTVGVSTSTTTIVLKSW